MGRNDHLHDDFGQIVVCDHCGKKYRQRTEDQILGFRDRDYDTCPYCKENNGSSMEVEFYNSKVD